jgi:hypothetical protein
MSTRLQVLLPEEEMESVRQIAKSESLTVGEYVRQVLREAESRRPSKSVAAKLAAIRKGSKLSYPTADIEQMNREIERGYRG